MYKKLRTHVHRRVLVQLVIFALVSIGLLTAVFYDAVMGQIGIGLVVAGLAVGLVAGFIVGRAFLLRWHEDTRKIIMSLDRMSFVLIAAYVAFRIFGQQLLGNYIHGATLSAFTFALLAGILLGRLMSVWRGVMRILRQQGIM